MDKHLDADALSDYAEGTADADARAAAEAHLASCAHCRRELAAAQAYFQALSGLEPARAPADFLAKVRARLPAPSPWRRAWAAFTGPLRAIPAPIAVAVLLGVTAIAVYFRTGGAGGEKAVPASSMEEAAPGESAPVAAAPSEPSPPVPGPSSEAKKDLRPAPPRLAARRGAGGKPVSDLPAAAPAKPAASAPPTPSATPAKRSDAAEPTAAPAAPSPEPAPEAGFYANRAEAPSPQDRDRSVAEKEAFPSGAASVGAAQAKEKAAPAAPKGMATEDDYQSLELSEMTSGSDRSEEASADQPASARAIVPGFTYTLSLRAGGDSAAVLKGLQAMGIGILPLLPDRAGRTFWLTGPASLFKGVGAYLSRYGTTGTDGTLAPDAKGDARVRLRMLFPAR